MPVVQIEQAIRDFEAWKAAFDRDPVGREASGVRAYEIYRPVDDPNHIAVDLEFDELGKAEAFKVSLEALWRSPAAAPALGDAPRARIVDVVERRRY
jgi:hypothetical protein